MFVEVMILRFLMAHLQAEILDVALYIGKVGKGLLDLQHRHGGK